MVGSNSLLYYDNLHLINTITSSNESLHLNTRGVKRKLIIKNLVALWHKRLGHIFKRRMKRLVSNENFGFLNFAKFDDCINYIKGKQTN